jgi:hypothetical protein
MGNLVSQTNGLLASNFGERRNEREGGLSNAFKIRAGRSRPLKVQKHQNEEAHITRVEWSLCTFIHSNLIRMACKGIKFRRENFYRAIY